MDLLEISKQRANAWLNSTAIDDISKEEIKALLSASDTSGLINAFYKELAFGTGGLRGIMGVGSNCINKYTIGKATQGLANYLNKALEGKISVAIACDSRNNSQAFTEITAHVFSANGIRVHVFPELRPTPMLSFAIRHLKCRSGVVITASHNPKEYNGYKAYWSDGAQLIAPHDQGVIDEVNAITNFADIKFEANPSLITTIGNDVEDAYYQHVLESFPTLDFVPSQRDIPVVYSALHGSGITMVPECLKRIGFTHVHVVADQQQPDGNFPTVQSPNPEEHSAMEQSLTLADEVGAELIMATDPDTDRVGIGIKNDKGEFFLLNGNQAFSLLMNYLMKSQQDVSDAYVAKTIVTTELVDTMAKQLGVDCVNTLTGFKYIAQTLAKREGKMRFIAAGEESYGYLVGDFVRDKDAVSACAFFTVMAAHARQEGSTLYQWLVQLYVSYGYYKEGLVNLVKKGAEGEQQIRQMMHEFRNSPPTHIAGEKVVRTLDYLTGEAHADGVTTALDFPKSDVLQFYTDQGSKVSVRPSGTEPKIKFYISVNQPLAHANQYHTVGKALDDRIEQIKAGFITGQ